MITMAVTLQQIADKAGVSRGTVDRALKNRGRIRPEVAERIKRIADEMGYQPSWAGRALAMAKRKIKIGVILQSAETPFMQQVRAGTEAARAEAESLGGSVVITEIEHVDAAKVMAAMEEMRQDGVQGIALFPSDDMLLQQTIDRFADEYGIPIVTLNGDLENTKRICFIGQDSKRSGAAAAGLIGEMTDSRGEVLVVSGPDTNPALNDRIKGFKTEIETAFPQIRIIGIRYSYDDDWVAEKIVEEELQLHPYLKGIYITGHGEDGVCRAVNRAGRKGSIKIVGHDFLEENLGHLKRGEINFLIGQEAYVQGYEPVMVLMRALLDKEWPKKEKQYTDIVIKSRYNI